jgi:hypothetical protein
MKRLASIVLGVMLLSAALAGVASAQEPPKLTKLTAFSGQANFMSEAGYTRYLKHGQTGQWTPFTP